MHPTTTRPPLRIVVTDGAGVTSEFLAVPSPVEPDPPSDEPLLGYRVRRRVGGLSPAVECLAALDEATARWIGGGVFCFELVALAFDGAVGDMEATWTGCYWSPWTKAVRP